MPWPIFYEGSILFRDGALAMSLDCCCGEPISNRCCVSTRSVLTVANASGNVDVTLSDDPPVDPDWTIFTPIATGSGQIEIPTNGGTGTVFISAIAGCSSDPDGNFYPVVEFRLSYDRGDGIIVTITYNMVHLPGTAGVNCDVQNCFDITENLNDGFAMAPTDDAAFLTPDVTISFECDP